MSVKKRGIMLKSLTLEDEGMQELINPVPLDLILDEDEDVVIDIETDEAAEDEVLQDVLGMLEDTLPLLDSKK